MAPQKRPLSTFQALRAATLQALPPARPAAKRRRTVARASTDGSSDDDADFAPLSSSRVAAASSSSATPRAKRSRAQGLTVDGSSSGRAFGVQSSDDTFVSSSNGVCVRPPPRASLPSLQRCALQSLSRGVKRLYLPDAKGGGLRLDVEDLLRQLPDHLKMLVWDVLLDTGSGFLHLNTISKCFVALPVVTLSGNLPALYNLKTLGVIPFHSQTTSLTLTGLSNVSDVSVADALRKMPNLEHLNLRGSTLVSQKTALALQSAAGGLRSLNLSETAIRVPDLQPLLLAAQRLGTLKLANIKGVTDPALGKLLDVLYADVGPSRKGPSVAAVRPLAALKTLKLRGNELSNSSLDRLLAHLPALERLDVSFSPAIRSLTLPATVVPQLSKLHLTGTALLPATILSQLVDAPSLALETLHLGALNNKLGWTPQDVWSLGEICVRAMGTLRRLHLAGNPDLTGTALSPIPNRQKIEAFTAFLLNVAPFIEHLDLALVPVKASYLMSAFASPAHSPVRELVLDETGVDDDLGLALSGCPQLEVLRIKNSKVSLDALFKILDNSPGLHTLDLTSCRGVPLRQRKAVFEAYDEETARRTGLGKRR